MCALAEPLPSHRCSGFARSVGGLGIVNASAALLKSASLRHRALVGQVLPDYGIPTRRTASGSASSGGALTAALEDAAVVLEAIQATWEGVNVSAIARVPFSLTLSSATPLVLRSARRSFSSATKVFVSGIRCNATAVSGDGEWLAAVLPGPADVCASAGGGSGDCSYATLEIENPPSAAERGARLSCPPFCSGMLSSSSGVIPLPEGSSSDQGVLFTPALVRPGEGPAALSALDFGVAEGTAYSPGLYFAEACSSSGIYTDPSTGTCTNLSSPQFRFCAFGSGAACEQCPSGAMCPGGFRCWSLPGYYTAAEASPAVLPCSQPGATSKCVGWNAALAATQCGPGYLQVGEDAVFGLFPRAFLG